MDMDELPALDELDGLVWKGSSTRWARAALPTGFAALDNFLPGGGWPLGGLIEVFVERYGIGELTLLIPALKALTRAGPQNNRKWVAWIAPPFVPYAPALKQRGVDVDALLLVQPAASGKDCLWTVEQVIRSGSSSGVLAWLAAADHVALRRLQLAAEEQGCWTVLFRPRAARRDRSPAALRIGVEQSAAATRVHIDKCRGARSGVIDISESLLILNREFADRSGLARDPARDPARDSAVSGGAAG
jgi:cell division inhibitor SulA/protein ImuA